MPQTHVIQSSFLSGVLDPRANARIETDAYNTGLKVGTNIEPIHLGGVRRRAGLRYRATVPNVQTVVAGSTITATAPRGGTANNAKDDDEATVLTCTTDVSTIDPYVMVHYDLGSAKAINYAEVKGLSSTAGSSTQFRIQYSTDNVTFTDFGTAFESVDVTVRDYRRKGPTTARYWRVAKVGGTDMGAVDVELSDFTLWQDSSTISEGNSFAFEISTSEKHIVVFTDRCASVYTDGSLVCSVPMPYVSADLAELDFANDAETMVIVHEDYPPRFMIRESSTNFQSFEIEFDSVPQMDYDDDDSPTAVSDVQVITFASAVPGDTFQIGLDGAKTGVVVYSGDANATEQASTARNIAREIQKMYTVRGFSGVTCSRTGTNAYTVTFADASANAYPLMTITTLSTSGGSATATVVQSVAGTSRHEDMWSSTRGYPRTVEFFEGRLWFGGTRSRQQTLAGSAVNNLLEFDPGEGLSDDPVLVTLNGSRLNAIVGLFAGRNFQIFTSGGEFRFVKEQGTPIVPGDVPANQTQYGGAKIHPVTIDGSTIFVQATGKAIRDFRYDYEQNAFDSLGVSSLAPHLINDVVDLAAWNGSATDEINLVFVVNGDGTVAVFNSRKEAQVRAWVEWETDGLFKSVAVAREDVYFLVRRTINATDYLFLEQRDADLYTDCAITVSQASSATVTGLGHLNGEECRVRADGYVLGNETPSSGSITADIAVEEVEVGLNFNVAITPMPLNTVVPTGFNFMRKRRVVNVRAMVRNTLGLYVNGRPLPDMFFDVSYLDTAPEAFTGVHELEETTNWDQTEEKLVEFTQVDPLPLELLGIDIQMESA